MKCPHCNYDDIAAARGVYENHGRFFMQYDKVSRNCGRSTRTVYFCPACGIGFVKVKGVSYD